MKIQIYSDKIGRITLSSRKVKPLRRSERKQPRPAYQTLSEAVPYAYSHMEEDLETKLLWLAVSERLSPKQRRMVELRADGLSDAKLARKFGLRCDDIPVVFDRIRSIALGCMGL